MKLQSTFNFSMITWVHFFINSQGNTTIKKNLIAKTNEVFADRLKYHLNH